VNTNSVEGFFGVLKRGIKAVYQHCGDQHLQRYLNESAFRYNNRAKLGVDDDARAAIAVRGIEAKRLTYRRIGNALAASPNGEGFLRLAPPSLSKRQARLARPWTESALPLLSLGAANMRRRTAFIREPAEGFVSSLMKRPHLERIPSRSAIITFPVGEDNEPLMESDLTDNELTAIGKVVVAWSWLEQTLYEKTIMVCKENQKPIPSDATNLSFKKRLRAFALLVERGLVKSPNCCYWRKLVSKIANAEQSRHKVVHGVWDFDCNHRSSLIVEGTRHPHIYQEKIDAEKLFHLADEIGRVIFAIRYPGDNPVAAYASSLRPGEPFAYARKPRQQRQATTEGPDQGLGRASPLLRKRPLP